MKSYRVDRRYTNGRIRVETSGNKRWDNYAVGVVHKFEAITMAVHAVTIDARYYDWAIVRDEETDETIFQCGGFNAQHSDI